MLSATVAIVCVVSTELEIVSFVTVAELWSWLADNDGDHPGVWVRLAKGG